MGQANDKAIGNFFKSYERTSSSNHELEGPTQPQCKYRHNLFDILGILPIKSTYVKCRAHE